MFDYLLQAVAGTAVVIRAVVAEVTGEAVVDTAEDKEGVWEEAATVVAVAAVVMVTRVWEADL